MNLWVGGGEQIQLPDIHIEVPTGDPTMDWVIIIGTIVVPLIGIGVTLWLKHRSKP